MKKEDVRKSPLGFASANWPRSLSFRRVFLYGTDTRAFNLVSLPIEYDIEMATVLVASFHSRPQLLHFAPDTASLTLQTLETPEFQDYTWISRHPSIRGLFYALQRYPDKHGVLSIVRLSSNSSNPPPSSSNKAISPPQLEIVKSYPSHGMDPCHLGLSSNADKLAIANVNTSFFPLLSDEAKERFLSSSVPQYDSSTVTIYTLNTKSGMVDEDMPPTIHDLAKLEAGSFEVGPHKARQEAPHPHGCFYVDSLDGFLVPDLGSDKLRLFGAEDDKSGRSLPCKRGAGPRHSVINPKGRYTSTYTFVCGYDCQNETDCLLS